MTGTIFRIERFAIHDGPGIRTTVFLKGCPLRCAWCHSPESQSPTPEFMPLADRCIGCLSCVAACPEHAIVPAGDAAAARSLDNGRPAGPGVTRRDVCRFRRRCVDACPTGARVLAGEEVSVDRVIEAIERDRVFYDESGGGVTFSGGEPLMQAPFLAALIEECRRRAIHVAVDTSGFGDLAALDGGWPNLFLFDLKAVDDAWHQEITGVSNRVILENLARVAATSSPTLTSPSSPARPSPRTSVIVRFPLVPGLTDADDNVHAVARVLSSLGIARVDVLPYHRAGLAKYERLGRPYALPLTEPPTPRDVQRAVGIFAEHRLDVRVGGA